MKQFNLFGQEEKAEQKYTSKIKAPIYEPKNRMPNIFELVDTYKTNRLITEIKNSNVTDNEKLFLIEAAKRHSVFNYELIIDYTAFEFRYACKLNERLLVQKIKTLDFVFDSYLNFFTDNKSILAVALAQGGDFIGGVENPTVINRPLLRKCMNSFICSVDRPFKFIGAMNEDVNTYTTLGSRGSLFFTIPMAALVQKATQKQTGGITDMYLKYGTYCKAFTTVMMHPSGVVVSMMNTSNPRIHHSISWNNTVPCIIDESHKK